MADAGNMEAPKSASSNLTIARKFSAKVSQNRCFVLFYNYNKRYLEGFQDI